VARFDYYSHSDGLGYLLDCQSDLLSHFDTRFVVPLLPLDEAPIPAGRLNPLIEIDSVVHSMVTQFAGSVPVRMLGQTRGSLVEKEYEISNALDMLMTGF
jgi:toxin CcdB